MNKTIRKASASLLALALLGAVVPNVTQNEFVTTVQAKAGDADLFDENSILTRTGDVYKFNFDEQLGDAQSDMWAVEVPNTWSSDELLEIVKHVETRAWYTTVFGDTLNSAIKRDAITNKSGADSNGYVYYYAMRDGSYAVKETTTTLLFSTRSPNADAVMCFAKPEDGGSTRMLWKVTRDDGVVYNAASGGTTGSEGSETTPSFENQKNVTTTSPAEIEVQGTITNAEGLGVLGIQVDYNDFKYEYDYEAKAWVEKTVDFDVTNTSQNMQLVPRYGDYSVGVEYTPLSKYGDFAKGVLTGDVEDEDVSFAVKMLNEMTGEAVTSHYGLTIKDETTGDDQEAKAVELAEDTNVGETYTQIGTLSVGLRLVQPE